MVSNGFSGECPSLALHICKCAFRERGGRVGRGNAQAKNKDIWEGREGWNKHEGYVKHELSARSTHAGCVSFRFKNLTDRVFQECLGAPLQVKRNRNYTYLLLPCPWSHPLSHFQFARKTGKCIPKVIFGQDLNANYRETALPLPLDPGTTLLSILARTWNRKTAAPAPHGAPIRL